MSWDQLLAVYRERAEIARQAQLLPPIACPNDGTPLIFNSRTGQRGCSFCGWRDLFSGR
jgi:uncharacterized Zn finger protein (UPF0148 family)